MSDRKEVRDHFWVTAHQTFEVDRPHLARIHVLSYEHLVTRVQECLDSVYAFLELEPHATSLVTRDGNEPYFVRWRGLSRVRRRLLVRRYEREVSRFGYSLRDADRSG